MSNRPSGGGGRRNPWVAVLACLVAVFGSAACIWYQLAPQPVPVGADLAAPLAPTIEAPAPEAIEASLDLADLKKPAQHRVAFSGEDRIAGKSQVGLEWLSDQQILTNLETVVFGSEFIGEDSDNVRKWVGPMRVAVYGDEDGTFTALVDSHLEKLHQLTQIDIARVSEVAPERNAHILFLSRAQFNSYAHTYLARGKPGTNRNIACFGIFKSNKREILEFHAMIPRSASLAEVKACVVEELTQVLGLPNDSFDIRPSIFNDDDEYHTLTWQDELFLRVLYDARITPGMGRAEFDPVARAIIAELRQEGLDTLLAAKAASTGSEPAAEAIPAAYPVIETPRLTRDLGQQ